MSHASPRTRHDASPLLRLAQRTPLLDVGTERQLLVAAREGDRKAVERLVVSHLRIVYSVAKSFHRNGVALDDLMSEGTMGLLEAIRRFDLSRDNRFSTYAGWWVRARLRRFAAAQRHMV